MKSNPSSQNPFRNFATNAIPSCVVTNSNRSCCLHCAQKCFFVKWQINTKKPTKNTDEICCKQSRLQQSNNVNNLTKTTPQQLRSKLSNSLSAIATASFTSLALSTQQQLRFFSKSSFREHDHHVAHSEALKQTKESKCQHKRLHELWTSLLSSQMRRS